MPMPTDIGIIDTMIGFPKQNFEIYDFIRAQTKDKESSEVDFPVEYMFKNVPKELYGIDTDPIDVTLGEMDRYNVEWGLIGVGHDPEGMNAQALKDHPDRFLASIDVDMNDIVGSLAKVRAADEAYNLRAISLFPAGMNPQINIDDAKMYPLYALACELDVAVFCCAGIPGPRLPFAPQHVERIDQVMYDFPELTFVTRHGCEPWEALAVKLMLKWPGLYYSTSAFAPKHYPKAIIDYANSRGADKIIYAGYFPMGLSLDRIMSDMQNVPFKDHVWPKFLRDNARKVLKLD